MKGCVVSIAGRDYRSGRSRSPGKAKLFGDDVAGGYIEWRGHVGRRVFAAKEREWRMSATY